MPEERNLMFKDFLDIIENPDEYNGVGFSIIFYIQIELFIMNLELF